MAQPAICCFFHGTSGHMFAQTSYYGENVPPKANKPFICLFYLFSTKRGFLSTKVTHRMQNNTFQSHNDWNCTISLSTETILCGLKRKSWTTHIHRLCPSIHLFCSQRVWSWPCRLMGRYWTLIKTQEVLNAENAPFCCCFFIYFLFFICFFFILFVSSSFFSNLFFIRDPAGNAGKQEEKKKLTVLPPYLFSRFASPWHCLGLQFHQTLQH